MISKINHVSVFVVNQESAHEFYENKLGFTVKAGTFGFGVFECDDLGKTYGELISKGVPFNKPQTREPYAYQVIFTDDSGNWFALSEKPKA